MEEARHLGLNSFWCDVRSIGLKKNEVFLTAAPLLGVSPDRKKDSFIWGESKPFSPKDFTSLHYRVDPPVDHAYLHPLKLLTFAQLQSPVFEIVNPPPILFLRNEKFEAALLGSLMPESCVSCQWDTLKEFGLKYGRTVLKPLDQAQSKGVECLNWKTRAQMNQAKKLLRTATHGFQTPVILQRYLPGIQAGEVRLWFLDGKLLASVKKHPLSGDFRVNLDQGSRLSPVTLDAHQKRIAQRISRHLKAHSIRLAALDLIEDQITDFNFTSPGLIPQMEALLQVNLARTIISTLYGI